MRIKLKTTKCSHIKLASFAFLIRFLFHSFIKFSEILWFFFSSLSFFFQRILVSSLSVIAYIFYYFFCWCWALVLGFWYFPKCTCLGFVGFWNNNFINLPKQFPLNRTFHQWFNSSDLLFMSFLLGFKTEKTSLK